MALLRRTLRHVTVAAALLVLSTACVTFVAAQSATDFTAAEQTATAAFLDAFKAANAYLADTWTGTDFCTYLYVDCPASPSTPSLAFEGTSGSAIRIVLPELDTSIDGSEVIFTAISAIGTADTPLLTGTLPDSWSRLTKVQTLKLDNNALTGTLPETWSALTNLNSLSLMNDQLSGTLPPSWSALTQMQSLYLNSNSFTGTIPEAYGDWNELTQVEMLNNELCGCLPATWTASTTLIKQFDAAVTASDCATANVCPTTAPATPSCGVPGCATCAEGSTTICAVCGRGQTMGIGNVTCNISGNGAGLPLPAGLVAVAVAAVALLVSVAAVL